MSYLPSKKVRVVALVVLIVLIGFFWYVGKQKNKKMLDQGGLTYTSPELIAQQEQEKKLSAFIQTKIAEQGGLQNASVSDFELAPVFSDADLIISTDNSPAALKQYGLNLKASLAPLGAVNPNEAKTVIEAIDNQDQAKISILENRAAEFYQMTQMLASTSVPSKATNLHLALTNHIIHLNNLLVDMAGALTEPVVALEAAKVYSVASIEIYNTLSDLDTFFTDNKITFSEND